MTTNLLIPRHAPPSYKSGYARSTGEAASPGLRDGLFGAWVPSLGVSGNTLFDISGHGNDGTLAGDPQWEMSENGWVLAYDGTGDKIDVSTRGVLGGADRTTIAWVKTTASKDNWIFEYGTEALGERYTWRVDLSDGNVSRLEVSGGYSIGTTVLNDGNWHLVAVVTPTNDIADTIHYVDGELDATAGSGSYTINTTSTFNIDIGNKATGSAAPFTGSIGNVYHYNRALTPNEIQQLYVDPLAPFRLKPRVFSFGAAAPVVGGLTVGTLSLMGCGK